MNRIKYLIAFLLLFPFFSYSANQLLVSDIQKISLTEGGFTGETNGSNVFNRICNIGDIDGDGIDDLASGVFSDNDGGFEAGAVWILFMNSDNTVKSQQKISYAEGNFNADILGSRFGCSVESLGDFDNDGIPDIAVGAYYDSEFYHQSGAVWILCLNRDGTVKSFNKISAGTGNLEGLGENRFFGIGIANLGDINNDGLLDIAVGVPNFDADGGTYKGSIWMLSLNEDGTVADQFIISEGRNGFEAEIDSRDRFGSRIDNVGDINGDGIVDIAVNAWGDDDGEEDTGAFYILFLDENKKVKDYQKISATEGNFDAAISPGDKFGMGCKNIGDFNGDNTDDLFVSCHGSNDGAEGVGKAFILFLNEDATVLDYKEINYNTPGFSTLLDAGDHFGISFGLLPGYDDNGKIKIAVCASKDDDGYDDAGAIYIIELEFANPNEEKDCIVSIVQKISLTQGGFSGETNGSRVFNSIRNIGDIDGDGIDDLASGTSMDSDGGLETGSVWILFMNSDNTVKSQQKISYTEGNFNADIRGSHFGYGVESLGDLDNDGIPDIAVGAYYDNEFYHQSGAIWILCLNRDGTVKSNNKISAGTGNLEGLGENRFFGTGIANLGDINNDGLLDIAVGVPNFDADGGLYKGSIWMLSLNEDGTVADQFIISEGRNGFEAEIDDRDRFGWKVDNIGDINGDGIVDIAVYVWGDDDGEEDTGAFYILFLDENKKVKDYQKISATEGNFNAANSPGDAFGFRCKNIGDFNGDNTDDLIVSCHGSNDGAEGVGKAFILFLNEDATVLDYKEINYNTPGFSTLLDVGDHFASSFDLLSGYNDDGKIKIAVCASKDDDGYDDAGAIYIIELEFANPNEEIDDIASIIQKISITMGGFSGETNGSGVFHSIRNIGDIDGDGIEDLATGVDTDIDGGFETGAIWILFMNSDYTVKSQQKISYIEGNFNADIRGSRFGYSVEPLGDFNNDGIPDIAVGAYCDSEFYHHGGAVWILCLNRDGTVKSYNKISAGTENLEGLGENRSFGSGIANLGDINNDGLLDIVVGVPTYDADGGLYKGSIWMISLNEDGTVADLIIISEGRNGFEAEIDDRDRFGSRIDNIGDINGDGIVDIAVSALGDDDGEEDTGAFYILFLDENKKVKDYQKISATEGNFNASINTGDAFGMQCKNIGDFNADNTDDLLVSCSGSNDGAEGVGKAFILFLNEDATVLGYKEISYNTPGYSTLLDTEDHFASSIDLLSGYDDNGKIKIAVCAQSDDDGYENAGAIYIIEQESYLVTKAGNDTTVCSNEMIMLDGSMSSLLNNGVLSYHWSSNQLEIVDSSQASPSIIAPIVEETTKYEFYLKVSRNNVLSDPDTVTVNINPAPEKPVLEQINDTLRSSTSTNYQWFFEGTEVEEATSQKYIFETSGNYHVVVTNEYGCVSEPSPDLYVTITSIGEMEFQISVFPNPVDNWVSVTGLPVNKDIKVDIYDINGQAVMQTRINYGNANIDLSRLKNGTYLFVIDNKISQGVRLLKK